MKTLLKDLLQRIHAKADFTDAACPWQRCLRDVLQLVNKQLDATRSAGAPSTWADQGEILDLLNNQYADVLDQNVQVAGTNITLTLDVLSLDTLYSNPAVLPDAEHRFIALLVAEGVFEELVTTNWDGLIEKAHAQVVNGHPQPLTVVVEANDIPGSSDGRARLTKAHGCACRCIADPAKRALLVATRRQLQKWETDNTRIPLRELIRTLLREKPSVFIGLSVQDWNLQVQMLNAFANLTHAYAADSRALFAEPELKLPQRTVLSHLHGDDYEKHRDVIEDHSTLHLFAKPFLGSLFVISLRQKAEAIVDAGASELTSKWESFVRSALAAVESEICVAFDLTADPDDPNKMWKSLASSVPKHVARVVRVFQAYIIPSTDDEYHALRPDSLGELKRNLAADEQPKLTWLIFTLAALHKGVEQALWLLSFSGGLDPARGQFEVHIGGRTIALFIVPDSWQGSSKLREKGLIPLASGSNVAVIYVTGETPRTPRHSPHASLPYGATADEPAEIWIHDLARHQPDPESLAKALRDELLSA